MRFKYRIYRLFEVIKNFPREVKYFIQRGRRGWSDKDLWSLDDYLAQVIGGSLKDLSSTIHGYPDSKFKSFEEFQKHLVELSDAFNAYTTYEDKHADEFRDLQRKHGVRPMIEFTGGKSRIVPQEERGETVEYTKELLELFDKQNKHYKDIVDRMRKIFDVWGSLWD